jgi:uncharacterized protein YukE
MPMNLANAFEKPVSAGEHGAGLTGASADRFQQMAAQIAEAWGIPDKMTALDLTGTWKGQSVSSFQALLDGLDRDVEKLLAA